MAVASRGRSELMRQWRDRATSPERTKVWTEPKTKISERKVPVVYYLCRNGQLEHPHFMEVTLSSSDGLYLRGTTIDLDFFFYIYFDLFFCNFRNALCCCRCGQSIESTQRERDGAIVLVVFETVEIPIISCAIPWIC